MPAPSLPQSQMRCPAFYFLRPAPAHAPFAPALCCSKLRLGGSLRAELSPMQATVGADGRLTAERLDVRIKTGGWGGLAGWWQGATVLLVAPPALPRLILPPPLTCPPPPLPPRPPPAGLGPWRQGLHLVSWGSASLQPPRSLDATLCITGGCCTCSPRLPALPCPVLPCQQYSSLPWHALNR